MPKKEMEFFDVEKIPWRSVEGVPGAWEKILSIDKETGSHTRILKFELGVETHETLQHDFWEEVYILRGGLIDKGRRNQVITEGMYACRPPGMKHGPFWAPIGCMALEMRYYKNK